MCCEECSFAMLYTTQMDLQQQWVLLRKQIDGLVGHLTIGNVRETSVLLFKANIIWGQGLVCRSVIQNVMLTPHRAPELAALVAVLNSKVPAIGEIVLARVVALFKRAYVNNNKRLAESMALFLCELTLHKVVEDVAVLQVLQTLLEKAPTDDSIGLAITMLRRIGAYLTASSKAAANMVFDRLRVLLQEGKVLAISQRRITEMFRLRRDGLLLKIDLKLDLVEEDDLETHFVDLSEQQDVQLHLNYFYADNYEQSKEEHDLLVEQVLQPEEVAVVPTVVNETQEMTDLTNAELLQQQKNIYLTVMSSMSADEAVHKLMKLKKTQKLQNEVLIDMILKCCAQEKTYSKYFGVIAEKICGLGRFWQEAFANQFVEKYNTIFQYEGAQLRNMGKLFGHLIAADILPPEQTLGHIVLTEGETSSAGRVFIKFIFQELVEELGIGEVTKFVQDPYVRTSIGGLFPVVNVTTADLDHIMFSINYFTAIGLGVLTEEMREVLKNLPEEREGRKRRRDSLSSSRSGSYSRSASSASYSRSRSRSYSRSRSPSRSRSASGSDAERSRSYLRSPLRNDQ